MPLATPPAEAHAHDFLRLLDTAQPEAVRKKQFVTYLNQVFGTTFQALKLAYAAAIGRPKRRVAYRERRKFMVLLTYLTTRPRYTSG